MMEAISQQTKIESTLDVAENLNNEETNLKLNVIDNLQNNDERVICDAEAEAEDDAEESSQGNDPEEDERSVPAEIQNSVEAPVNDESCVNLDDEDKDKENIVKEPSGLNNNDDSSDSIVETQIQEEHISDRTTKHESNNIDEDELLRSDDDEDQYDGKSPRTSRGRMHYIDISDDREEELLRSDDEDLEEKDKINNDDSLDIFSNDEENSCDVVMNKTDNVNEDVESQHEQQKESEDEDQYEHQVVENEDKSTKEREDDKEIVSISDEESILSQNEEESEKQIERDDQSCDESEQQIEREDKSCDEFDSEKQIERDDKSCDELDSEKQIERDDKSCDEFDSEKQIERDNKSCDENDSEKQIEAEDKSDNERDDVISLDDETIDDAKDIEEEDHKKEQTETEYITINEESLDTVENDENKVQLQRANTNSLENIVDVDENSLHSRQSNEESKKNVDQNLLNGDESSSDECRVKDIDEENESQSGFNIDNIKTEGHNHSGSPSGSLLEDESVLSRRISLENSISNDNSFVNRIKQQFKQENDDEMPKINGDHKLPETEEDTDTAVIDIQDNSLASIKINYSNHEMKKEMLSSDEEDDFESNLKIVDESNQFDNDLKDIDVDSNANEDIKPNIYSGGRIIENIKMSPTHETPGTIEDEASSSSMASSVSASSGTSSSHQLVIDHPIEDIEVLAVKSSKEPSKVKAPLKRKLSQTSDHSNTSSQHKQPHLEMEPETVEMKDSSALEVNYCNGDEKINDVRPEPESTTLLKLNNAPVATPENSEVSNEAQVSLSPARGSPLLNSLLTKLKQLPERSKKPKPIKSNQTKFLCFNCKTGSFNSLIALNEHQRVCLANKSLLPATIVSQTPPQSPVPQKMVSPSLDTNKTIEGIPLEKKRYYKCSSCDTYHENWNLFLHIREKHKRHMCLYCIRMFPTAEKLSLHLEIKHDLEQNHFNSEETLRKTIDIIQGVASESRFLMCCTCQHVFMENEPFSDHVCTLYMQACSLCGQKGRHSSQCKAQIEAKKSKVKRKNKDAMKLPNGSKTATVPIEACSNQPLLPISSCDKIPLQSKFPTPTSRISPSPLHQNEDSNSSCNMIIDETCNNTHYSSNARYNPFRALDERERQEQKVDVSEPDLPPDRSRSDQASEKPAPIQPLIVPKFKLRVPKEFQKSVDAAISSTESEEDDEIHEEDPDTSTEKQKNIATPSQKVDVEMKSVTEVYNSNGKPQSSKQNNNPDDEDSLDEPNSNLVRILQEIERTKMDIKRTKETLQSSKPLPATPRLATISQSSSRTGEQNWSPTPPASPNSQWFTPRRMVSQGESAEEMARKSEMDGSLLPSLPAQPPSFEQDRKDATGSDVDMDIDNTISAPSKQSIERSPKELDVNESQIPESVAEEGVTSKMETSTESNLENSDITNTTNESDEKTEKHTSVVPEPMELGEEQHKESPIEELSTGKTQDAQSSSTEKVILSKSSPPTHIESPDNKEEKDIDVCDKQDDLSLRKKLPEDGIEVADEEVVPVELQLDRPLEKFEIVEFVRICLKAVYPLCLYCNHARRIAVNGKSLVLHLISQHRFVATVDSITAEELKPETIVAKFKSYLPDLKEHYFNSNSYCTMGNGAFTHPTNERIFECFQCRFVTSTHKELYLHNRKMHLKTAILCFMCRANFFSFSEILCHVCPGEPNKVSVFDVKFRCCLCELDNIPSPFRLMVHLRKKHFACDVCLEDCRDQGRLSSHVWKHKLHHLCYRCGIAYRNKMDITKHLFWKHGTESIICKRCLQKRWRHVYHFCVPPTTFVCDVCNLCFSKATYLKVHKRIHTGDLRYPCADENCDQKFISRRLLLKHSEEDHPPEVLKPVAQEPEKSETEPGKNTVVKDEENIKIKEENVDGDVESVKKSESNVGEKKETNPELDDKSEVPKEEKKTEEAAGTGKIRKKKKSKRSKESLEDLNLIAPNLSESDSSDDSDVECKSKSGDDALVPKVMLSPPSEHEQDKEDEKDTPETGKVLEIWQNFIQATGGVAATPALEKPEADYTEDYYPTPNLLHVVQSDHDYCMMFKPAPPVSLQENLPEPSPVKRKSAKSPRRSSTRRSNASSSSSGSSSSSDSSCSCGSNCSCSSSNSNSSSSSSSSDDSGDSSAASNTSKKRHRKKSERDRMRKKSESASPMKKHNLSETAKNEDDDVNVGTDDPPPNASALPNEPLFQESDLETAESDTDEEFYDEHPQKLASELLAQKRAQLMAQTRLSPSHNYDIVENSRPSTPSLPDEVAREKKVKLKKKKRDRKSTSRSAAGVQGSKLHFGKSPTALQSHQSSTGEMSVQPQAPIHSHRDYKRASPSRVERGTSLIQKPAAGAFPAIHAMTHQLTPRPIGPHHMGRMSEGSSCSDADASLKRSKRARRPNKFYGYTSDDENMVSGLGQPVMIGMRAIKPQPPPQLTWRKEDLPTPSKSILNNKNKVPRTPKTPNSLNVSGGGLFDSSMGATSTLKKKRMRGAPLQAGEKVGRKRMSKKQPKLPPIPTLKIRPSQIGLPQPNAIPTGTNHIPASQIYSSSKESDDDDDEEDTTDSTSDEETEQLLLNSAEPSTSKSNMWGAAPAAAPPSQAPVVFQASLVLPPVAPAPPTPQASAFNQKIPPALLPNPNFATLQYFKANNIRYPIRPPAGARQAREGESVYCYCRCPYDEVSEMIACDGENCLIEWFHFECVGIMVAPQGKWFCAECRPKYSEELYPSGKA